VADDTNITKLPVRFKPQVPSDKTLVRPWEVGLTGRCIHQQFIVDPEKAEVECATCKEKLSPMWVLSYLCTKDTQMHEAAKRYKDEMQRLADRSKTKCRHCGKMTDISRR
jgi:hypothetical protein